MIALLATERPLDYFVPSSQLDGFLGSQIPLSHSSPSWLSKIYRTTLHCTDAKKKTALLLQPGAPIAEHPQVPDQAQRGLIRDRLEEGGGGVGSEPPSVFLE